MKYILTESQTFFLRRLSIIDGLINSSLEMFSDWDDPRLSVKYMIYYLSEDVTELYFFRYADDYEVGGEEYQEFLEFLKKYLNSNWKDRIKKEIKTHKVK